MFATPACLASCFSVCRQGSGVSAQQQRHSTIHVAAATRLRQRQTRLPTASLDARDAPRGVSGVGCGLGSGTALRAIFQAPRSPRCAACRSAAPGGCPRLSPAASECSAATEQRTGQESSLLLGSRHQHTTLRPLPASCRSGRPWRCCWGSCSSRMALPPRAAATAARPRASTRRRCRQRRRMAMRRSCCAMPCMT